MRTICLVILCFTYVVSYQYLTIYTWQKIRKIFNENNNELKVHIFNDYKYRTYLKAKEFKLLNKNLTKNIKMKELGKSALIGLYESINSYNPNDKINFAKHSDMYIFKNLLNVVNKRKHKNNKFKWWEPYWNYIDNDLNPTCKKILRDKYSNDFTEKQNNNNLAIKYNTTTNNVTEIITTSLYYVYNKVYYENKLGNDIILRKLDF